MSIKAYSFFDIYNKVIVIDKNYRGKSIGKKLLLEAFNLAKKDNMKNLQMKKHLYTKRT